MNEPNISSKELEKLAAVLAETFIQRWDIYPQQLENGSYLCVKELLTPEHIIAHLKGEITLSVYLLDPDC